MGIRMDDIHAPTVASGPTTNGTSANGTEKKLSVQELIAQKENIEAELSALGSVLDSHGVNMNTSLTTFDGYPRADIDVAQIRTTRARIIILKNDHKAIMKKVEDAIHEHFANGGKGTDTPTSTLPSRAVQSNTPRTAATIEPPFAKVNSVAPSSPAERAGLQAGDKVTSFGGVNWTTEERLSRLAQVVQQNENREVLVKVLRESTSTNAASSPLQLRLIPRRDWGGRGLLGCHLLPL